MYTLFPVIALCPNNSEVHIYRLSDEKWEKVHVLQKVINFNKIFLNLIFPMPLVDSLSLLHTSFPYLITYKLQG